MARDDGESVLIVDDDPQVAGFIADVLGELGFNIAGLAASGDEAISIAVDSPRLSLALVDVRITGPRDGIEVASDLREQFGIPSIILTGLLDQHTADRAEAVTAICLHKPFRPSALLSAIESVLRPSHEPDAVHQH